MKGITSALPIVVSMAALCVSLATFLFNRSRDRRDLFLKFHEKLIEPDLQKGRAILYASVNTVQDAESLRSTRPDDYALVNRALSMFDVLGIYVYRRYVDKDVVLEEWGPTLAKAWQCGQHFVEHRAQNQGFRVWPNLRRLGDEAQEYTKAKQDNERWKV